MGSNAHQVSKYFSNSNCYFSRMWLKAKLLLIYWKHMSSNYFLIEVLHLADALILEHFHEGNTPIFQLWLIDSTENICICYSSHLAYWNNVIMEQFLQENVLLRHLLCLYAWRSYAQITATDIGEIFWYNWFYAPTSYQLYFKSFLDICWGVIRTRLAQDSKKKSYKRVFGLY